MPSLILFSPYLLFSPVIPFFFLPFSFPLFSFFAFSSPGGAGVVMVPRGD